MNFMSAKENEITVRDRTANPAPLGLLGFGMTTLMLSLHNAGYISLGAAILALGLVFGGSAQMMAGMMEWKKGNTFGTTAFISFGAFWLAVVAILLFPILGLAGAETTEAMAWFFLLWGVFSAFLTVGTLNTNRIMQMVFLTLTIVFFLLAASEALVSADIKSIAGHLGLLTGALAFYLAMAQVLNESLGRTVVPLFPVAQPKDRGSKDDPIAH
jgi:succinate-acetate transporter protein